MSAAPLKVRILYQLLPIYSLPKLFHHVRPDTTAGGGCLDFSLNLRLQLDLTKMKMRVQPSQRGRAAGNGTSAAREPKVGRRGPLPAPMFDLSRLVGNSGAQHAQIRTHTRLHANAECRAMPYRPIKGAAS